MSRRRRALLLLAGAAAAGILAIALVSGYSSSVAGTYGGLRPVIVVTRDLAAGERINGRAFRHLERRRVPARFLPVAALGRVDEAVGFELAAPVPAGSYLTGNLLRPPGKPGSGLRRAGPGRSPVELAVSGAGALTGATGTVDVLVTSEPTTGGRGRTVVAARRVPLISVGRAGESAAGPGLTQVTLGLTPAEARRLVQAESFARRVTVLPRGRGQR